MDDELKQVRDELDKLYKNWVVILDRASRTIEKVRSTSSGREDFKAMSSHWLRAGGHGSFFGDEIAKAIHCLDPQWSQIWANYAALLVLEPNEYHSPPALSPKERETPPTNMFPVRRDE
jgi:hypothetical protein